MSLHDEKTGPTLNQMLALFRDMFVCADMWRTAAHRMV